MHPLRTYLTLNPVLAIVGCLKVNLLAVNTKEIFIVSVLTCLASLDLPLLIEPVGTEFIQANLFSSFNFVLVHFSACLRSSLDYYYLYYVESTLFV